MECCNAPDTTFHIRNSNSCLFQRCDMIFPSWLGFVFCFAFCSCLAFHILASCRLHPHVFIKLASAHSFETNHTCNVAPRFVSCLLRGLLSDTLSLSTPLRPPLARVRNLSRTRPGLSLPMGPDHPPTSLKYIRFVIWTPYLFILDRLTAIGGTR